MTEQVHERYQCPGEPYTIGRGEHLARLGSFYPACRDCVHRCDAVAVPRRVKRQLDAIQRSATPSELFLREGVGGVFLNEFTPQTARTVAAAFGVLLRQTGKWGESLTRTPQVVLAGDGSPLAPELVAAAAVGLRWAGCQVIETGEATMPLVASVVGQLSANGGVLVANPLGKAHTAGMMFCRADGAMFSSDHGLDELRAVWESRPERPVRTSPPPRRFDGRATYLESFREHFHALRPLRIKLHTASKPFVHLLQTLLKTTACEILPIDQTADGSAHFGLWVDSAGQHCRVFDERGDEVPLEKLLRLLSRHVSDTGTEPGPRDAMWIVAHLLGNLSQSDWSLSEVIAAGPAR